MQHKPLTERQRYWLRYSPFRHGFAQPLTIMLRMSEYAQKQGFPVRAMYDAKKALTIKVRYVPNIFDLD